jgi:hypothetical protein
MTPIGQSDQPVKENLPVYVTTDEDNLVYRKRRHTGKVRLGEVWRDEVR